MRSVAVLIVDDECDLAGSLRSYQCLSGIRLYHARSVEKAVRTAKQLITKSVRVFAIVDMFLPLTENNLKAVDQLRAERSEILSDDRSWEMLTGSQGDSAAGDSYQVRRIRSLIDRTEREEYALLDRDGGVLFLRQVAPPASRWRVVIVSGLDLSPLAQGRLSGIEIYAHLAKPVLPYTLVDMIKDFANTQC